MATFVYDNAANQFTSQAWLWPSLAVNVALLNANYQPKTSDVYLSSVPAGAFVVRDVALTGLGVTSDGVAYGIIPQYLALVSVFPITAVLLYIKGANDGVSSLIYYSSDAVGMPLQPKGLNWSVAFNQIRRGFFQV